MIPESYGIERVDVSALTAFSGNPRTHSDTQIDQIAASICEFGWTNPILVDAEGTIIAGHGRLAAAKQYLRGGASPRAVQALVAGAKLRALLQGRANGSTDDVKALAKPVLRHRLLLNFDAEADRVRPDQVIEQMLAELDKAR